MNATHAIVGTVAALLMSAPVGAQQRGREQQRPTGRRAAPEQAQASPRAGESAAPAANRPAPKDSLVITHHSARIGGQEINYTATTGTYVVKDDAGTPKASFFFVAYTKDGVQDTGERPVSFVYNGGPGSASLFTHMGMGPKRVVLTADGHGMPAPYSITDNEDSFLDATDLVFIDAVSTGFSRPVPGQDPSQFYGVVQDANIFSDFIYQYVTRNER